MFKTRNLLVVVLLSFLVLGCATSSAPVEVSYDTSENQRSFQTQKMPLQDVRLTSGLSKQPRFYLQIEGNCSGEDCKPREFRLNIIKEGMESIEISGRDLTLTVGTETLEWEDPQNREVSQTVTIRDGSLVKVNISRQQLVTLGSVSNVHGTVGGTSFSVSHEDRAPIRNLVSRLESDDSESSSSS